MECYTARVRAGFTEGCSDCTVDFENEGSRHREIGQYLWKKLGTYKYAVIELLYYANDPWYLKCTPVLLGTIKPDAPSKMWKKLRDLHSAHWNSVHMIKR